MKPQFGSILLIGLSCCRVVAAAETDPWKVDFRYTIPWWQTLICLPDDWQKSLVGKDGELLYDYPGKIAGFQTRITCGIEGPTTWVKQELASPRVPVVRTLRRAGEIEVLTEAFAVPRTGSFFGLRAEKVPVPLSSRRADVALDELANGQPGASGHARRLPSRARPIHKSVKRWTQSRPAARDWLARSE